MTNQKKILFREDILQQNWTLIKDDVKKFNASSSQNCMALIDGNNDIWVCGDDSWVLGLNTEVPVRQPTLTKLKDILKDTDLYNHIDGKVKDYRFSTYKMYILTDENDSSSLYVSGHYLSYKWDVYSYLGNWEDKNCTIPTVILKNVEQIATTDEQTVTLVNNNGVKEIWCWGMNDGSMIAETSLGPTKWESATSLIRDAEDVRLLGIKYVSCYLGYEKDGGYRLGISGRDQSGSRNGLGMSSSKAFCEWENLKGERVVSLAFGHKTNSCIFFTDANKCFGAGLKRLLGMNCSNEDTQDSFVKLDLNIGDAEIIGISGGNGWYIITANDGRVFGTGANNYGVLGRWKGVSRGASNSRYKTAYEWVECPDLEI